MPEFPSRTNDQCTIESDLITADQVEAKLRDLIENKSAGVDGVTTRTLKNCAKKSTAVQLQTGITDVSVEQSFIHDHIMSFVSRHGLISIAQHGFIQRKGLVTASSQKRFMRGLQRTSSTPTLKKAR
jgi:hypothetical protein